jgi:hypothetical protein
VTLDDRNRDLGQPGDCLGRHPSEVGAGAAASSAPNSGRSAPAEKVSPPPSSATTRIELSRARSSQIEIRSRRSCGERAFNRRGRLSLIRAERSPVLKTSIVDIATSLSSNCEPYRSEALSPPRRTRDHPDRR